MNILKTSLFALFLTFVMATPVAASGTNCTTMYGGGYTGNTSCAKVTLDKKVLKPGTKDYVDNLTANDPKYQAGQEVSFQIVVQNVGEVTLKDVEIVDIFPSHLHYVAGAGSFDKNANTLTFKIDSLESGKSQTFHITAKVADDFSTDKPFACVTNHAKVKDNSQVKAEDSAQLCIERKEKVEPPVKGIKQTPPTGPADAALPLLVSMAGAGFYLTRKTRLMVTRKRGGVTK